MGRRHVALAYRDMNTLLDHGTSFVSSHALIPPLRDVALLCSATPGQFTLRDSPVMRLLTCLAFYQSCTAFVSIAREWGIKRLG